MTLREYVDSLQNKTVAVLGIGVSNTPLVRLLLDSGIRVTACDRRTSGVLGGHGRSWARWPMSWSAPAAACVLARTI